MGDEFKPIVIIVENQRFGGGDYIENGYITSNLSACIRRLLDYDVLLFRGSWCIQEKKIWKIIESFCKAGLVSGVFVQPRSCIEEGDDVEKLYNLFRSRGFYIPFLVHSVWGLEKPIVGHPEDHNFIMELDDLEIFRRLEQVRQDFSGEKLAIKSRLQQFWMYRSLFETTLVESVMPCSDIGNYANVRLGSAGVDRFEREAEIIRSLDEAGRKKFQDEVYRAEGLMRNDSGPGLLVVRGGAGMGPNCACFSANSWTRDIILTQKGQCHGLSKLKMRFLVEAMAEFRKELGHQEFSIEPIGGYIFHKVGNFKTPILQFSWHRGEYDDPEIIAVGKFVFSIKLAFPIDREFKLIE
ncbi:MAG: hypothetical protein WCI52_01665 [bacterium]